MTTAYLIDKSAHVRLNAAADPDVWIDRIDRGLVHVSTLTLLEIGFSARNAPDHDALVRRAPVDSMLVEHLRPSHEERALAVQRELAARGQHRGVAIPDLLIAAIAELSGLVVLYADRSFDLIADITGQRVLRLSGSPAVTGL